MLSKIWRATRAAIAAGYRFVKEEPAAVMGVIQAALFTGVGLGAIPMDGSQATLAIAAVAASGGLVQAVMTRPFVPAALTGFTGAVVALLAGYGIDLDPEVVGSVNTLLVAISTLLLRAQVTARFGLGYSSDGFRLK